MLNSNLESLSTDNDTELVRATLGGDREAFGRIVGRYQTLVCSLAYSATGNLSQSEDLAQETFVAAWKSLSRLPEPENLRAWLCGIARNLINNSLRKQHREPSHAAEGIETIDEEQSLEPLPVERAISNEEQAILWRSLGQIPELYREPLILFYREHQSVESVAEKLALTPDTTRQRLSRGRKLLAGQMTAFVESALAKTSPGKNFTLAVLAALPLMTATARAVTTGAAIAKGGAVAKSALTIGVVGGFLAMIGGALVTLKAHADDSQSARERQFMLRHFGMRLCLTAVVMAGVIGLSQLDYFHSSWHLSCFVACVAFLIAFHSAVILPRVARRRRQIQIEDGTFDATEWTTPRKTTDPDGANNRLKALKFMALGLGATVYVLIDQPWKTSPSQAVFWVLFMLVCLGFGFYRWRSTPRFNDFRRTSVLAPVLCWVATLGSFDWYQYQTDLRGTGAGGISNTDVLLFNLIVSCAYIVLLAGLALNYRRTGISAR